MAEPSEPIVTWLKDILRGVPTTIRALCVESSEAPGADAARRVALRVVGYETLVDGPFDPKDPEHVAALGQPSWRPADDATLTIALEPEADWPETLRCAAETHEVVALATARGLRLLACAHDGPVNVVR